MTAWIRVVRDELARIEFKWRPTVVVAWVCFALIIPHYQPRGEWFWSVFPRDVAYYLKHVWLGPEFLLEVGGSVVVMLALRESLKSYGLGLGDWRFGLKAMGVLSLLFAPLFVIFCTSRGFHEYYGGTASLTLREFMLEKVPGIFFFMIMTELFFRGFLLYGIKKHYGTYAGVLASQLSFVVWHFDKPQIEAFGSFPVGLALAFLTVRTNSIWYGVLLHGTIAVLLESTVFLGRGSSFAG